MADTKISALTAATTPLAGTEVLPIVQSGVTKKVAVSDLTAGRAVSAASLTLTGSPLGVASGGTGLTVFNSGGLVYASSSSALATSSNLIFDATCVGLFATPSAWGGAYKAVVVNNPSNSFFGWNGGALCGIAAGAYIDSGYTWRYNLTGQAVTMYQANDSGGNHAWLIANSGTSGNAITWTTAMQILTSSGDVKANVGNLQFVAANKGLRSDGGWFNQTAASVAAGGTLDLTVPSSGFVGILSVSNTRDNYTPQSRRVVYGIACYGTTVTTTQLHIQDGTGGGPTFSLSVPSAGTLRWTDTSGDGSTHSVYLTFSGSVSAG